MYTGLFSVEKQQNKDQKLWSEPEVYRSDLTIRKSWAEYIVEQSAYVYVQYMRRGLQMFDIDSVEAPGKVCPDLYGLLAVFFSVFQC